MINEKRKTRTGSRSVLIFNGLVDKSILEKRTK